MVSYALNSSTLEAGQKNCTPSEISLAPPMSTKKRIRRRREQQSENPGECGINRLQRSMGMSTKLRMVSESAVKWRWEKGW